MEVLCSKHQNPYVGMNVGISTKNGHADRLCDMRQPNPEEKTSSSGDVLDPSVMTSLALWSIAAIK